jgi:hypothetical protein
VVAVYLYTVCMLMLLSCWSGMYWCNLARCWLQAVWGWHDNVETCSSVIICEIVVHLLVTVQNDSRCTVQVSIQKLCVCLYRNCDRSTLICYLTYQTLLPSWPFIIGSQPAGRRKHEAPGTNFMRPTGVWKASELSAALCTRDYIEQTAFTVWSEYCLGAPCANYRIGRVKNTEWQILIVLSVF